VVKVSANLGWQRALVVLTGTVVGVVVVSCLYWAQTVLVPVVRCRVLTPLFLVRVPIRDLQDLFELSYFQLTNRVLPHSWVFRNKTSIPIRSCEFILMGHASVEHNQN
jgi:hypothetical protein